MINNNDKEILNLDNYPKDTEYVLAAGQQHQMQTGDRWSYQDIADATGMTKQQVRYRVDQLVDDGYVSKRVEDDERGVSTWVFKNVSEAKTTGASAQTLINILGDIPEEPSKEDILKLVALMVEFKTAVDEIRGDIQNLKRQN